MPSSSYHPSCFSIVITLVLIISVSTVQPQIKSYADYEKHSIQQLLPSSVFQIGPYDYKLTICNRTHIYALLNSNYADSFQIMGYDARVLNVSKPNENIQNGVVNDQSQLIKSLSLTYDKPSWNSVRIQCVENANFIYFDKIHLNSDDTFAKPKFETQVFSTEPEIRPLIKMETFPERQYSHRFVLKDTEGSNQINMIDVYTSNIEITTFDAGQRRQENQENPNPLLETQQIYQLGYRAQNYGPRFERVEVNNRYVILVFYYATTHIWCYDYREGLELLRKNQQQASADESSPKVIIDPKGNSSMATSKAQDEQQADSRQLPEYHIPFYYYSLVYDIQTHPTNDNLLFVYYMNRQETNAPDTDIIDVIELPTYQSVFRQELQKVPNEKLFRTVKVRDDGKYWATFNTKQLRVFDIEWNLVKALDFDLGDGRDLYQYLRWSIEGDKVYLMGYNSTQGYLEVDFGGQEQEPINDNGQSQDHVEIDNSEQQNVEQPHQELKNTQDIDEIEGQIESQMQNSTDNKDSTVQQNPQSEIAENTENDLQNEQQQQQSQNQHQQFATNESISQNITQSEIVQQDLSPLEEQKMKLEQTISELDGQIQLKQEELKQIEVELNDQGEQLERVEQENQNKGKQLEEREAAIEKKEQEQQAKWEEQFNKLTESQSSYDEEYEKFMEDLNRLSDKEIELKSIEGLLEVREEELQEKEDELALQKEKMSEELKQERSALERKQEILNERSIELDLREQSLKKDQQTTEGEENESNQSQEQIQADQDSNKNDEGQEQSINSQDTEQQTDQVITFSPAKIKALEEREQRLQELERELEEKQKESLSQQTQEQNFEEQLKQRQLELQQKEEQLKESELQNQRQRKTLEEFEATLLAEKNRLQGEESEFKQKELQEDEREKEQQKKQKENYVAEEKQKASEGQISNKEDHQEKDQSEKQVTEPLWPQDNAKFGGQNQDLGRDDIESPIHHGPLILQLSPGEKSTLLSIKKKLSKLKSMNHEEVEHNKQQSELLSSELTQLIDEVQRQRQAVLSLQKVSQTSRDGSDEIDQSQIADKIREHLAKQEGFSEDQGFAKEENVNNDEGTVYTVSVDEKTFYVLLVSFSLLLVWTTLRFLAFCVSQVKSKARGLSGSSNRVGEKSIDSL